MFLTLLIVVLIAAGHLIGERWIGLRPRAAATILGSSVALFLLLLALNGGLRMGLGMSWSLLFSVLFLLLFSAAGLKLELRLNRLAMSRLEWTGLFLGSLLIWCLTNSLQWQHVDEDYWIHTPIQANFKSGIFPPVNPYFNQLELRGHYGRDLMIGALARVSDWDVLRAQFHFTSLCVVALFLVCWLTFRSRHSASTATVATALAFLGMNTGHKVGLLQGHHANYAPAYLLSFLLLFFILRLYHLKQWRTALLLGLLMASTALVFETILVASVVGATLLFVTNKERLKKFVFALVLAAVLVFLQGGAFHHLFTANKVDSIGMKSQVQEVQVQFPKEQFLKIPLGGHFLSVASRYQPLKMVYEFLDRRFHNPDDHVSLFSVGMLAVHGLTLWLAPMTILLSTKEREPTAKLLCYIGIAAYLIPGLFYFGPVYDKEWFRWHFHAGLAFSLALGVVLSERSLSSRLWRVALGTILIISCFPGGHYALVPLRYESAPRMELAGLSFDTLGYTRFHGKTLFTYNADIDAITWLQAKCEPGKKILVDFNPEEHWEILFESTLAGRTGLMPVGHALPRPEDFIGKPPGRMKADYKAFLLRPSENLEILESFDYLYLRLPPERMDLVAELRSLGLSTLYLGDPGYDGKKRLIMKKM